MFMVEYNVCFRCQKGIYTSYKLYIKTLCCQSKGCKYVKIFAVLILNSSPQTSKIWAKFKEQNKLPTKTKKFH